MTSTATRATTTERVGPQRSTRRGGVLQSGRRPAPRHAAPRPKRAWPRDGGELVRRLVLAGLVLAGVWLLQFGYGLWSAAGTVEDRAGTAQAELHAFRDALTTGDEAAAEKHLEAGESALREARDASQDDAVRLAAGLPWIGRTVDDLDHLLRAADILTAAARDGMDVYTGVSGSDSELFADNRFNIPAIRKAQVSVADIKDATVAARSELRQVHGDGPKGGDVLAKKQSALDQIDGLRSEITALEPMLDALPAAVGADGARTYLVAIMNPAEMRASGGAPLSVAFLRLKDGRLTIPVKGATSELTDGNEARVWARLWGDQDPFQPPSWLPQRFVNLTFNPSFDVSGRQLVKGTEANFGTKTDGVIALDLVAIGHLLDATGPLESPTYGTLTSANLAQKLLVEGYVGASSDQTAVDQRHDSNEELMTAMLSRLTEGGGLIGKATALGTAIPSRHLQMWFRDPRLQQVVTAKGMGGTVPDPKVGNLTAVYTQNGNASKMDIFQRRVVKEVVRLRPDGSALVRRTVRLANDSPPYQGALPDPGGGYETRYATSLIINLMPDGARLVREPESTMPRTVSSGNDQDGRLYAKAALELEPGGSGSLTWEYVVPRAARVAGGEMTYVDHVAPQNLLNTPELRLTVLAPKGWTVTPSGGWQQTKRGAKVTVPMDSTGKLALKLSR